jgi:hypothetical protein
MLNTLKLIHSHYCEISRFFVSREENLQIFYSLRLAGLILIVGLDKSTPIIEKTVNRSFFKAVVTDMSSPHFHMVDKLGIFCKYIICWFG